MICIHDIFLYFKNNNNNNAKGKNLIRIQLNDL